MSTYIAVGAEIGGYFLQEVLGQGNLGTVYLAKRQGCRYAVKVLKAHLFVGPHGQEYVERFRREAEAASWVNHRHVVQVIEYGFGGTEQVPFLVMEYVQGISLTELIAEHDCLDYRDRAVIVRQIAGALAAIHEVGLVHRDVKPCNVLISRSLEAKLTDFGIVQIPDSELTLANQTVIMMTVRSGIISRAFASTSTPSSSACASLPAAAA